MTATATGSRVLVYLKASIESKTTWYAENEVLQPLFRLDYPESPRIFVEAQFCANQFSMRGRHGGFEADDKRKVQSCPVRFEISQLGSKAVDSIRGIAQGVTISTDMGTYEALGSALTWVAKDAPLGDKDALVIWGHGGAWRGVAFLVTLMQTADDGGSSSPPPEPSEPTRTAPDDKVLQPIELAASLQGALHERKLGLIAFQSCLMSSLEVAYDLRRYAYWMVASSSFIDYADWDWLRWIGEFISDPNSTAQELREGLRRHVKDPRTLSLIDLGQIDNLVVALEDFGDVAMQTPGAKALVIAANKPCKRLGGVYSGTIDLFEFFDRLQQADLQTGLRTAVDGVLRALRATLPVAWHPQPTGLAIFFPETLKEARTIYGFNAHLYEAGPMRCSTFVEKTSWRNFLDWLWT